MINFVDFNDKMSIFVKKKMIKLNII